VRERAAAERVFGLLPDDQRDAVRRLWEEFELKQTAEAKFAQAMDRLMPVLHNYFTEGRSWREHNVTQEQALAKNKKIADGARELWDLAQSLIVASLQ
jgi:putative hydrolase of HD superfamily